MDCDVAYEVLVAFADGDLDETRQLEIDRHVTACEKCRERLQAVLASDAVLTSMKRLEPSAGATLSARRALAEVIRRPQLAEIMTLDEAADFLRITLDQLGELVEELPAFELAGQIRLRRERLIEWIQQRERDYVRQGAASWVSRAAAVHIGKGVA